MKFAQALLLIPPGVYLKCGRERNPETGVVFGSACLFQEAPDGGWLEPRHPADKFRDRVVTSISTDDTDFEAFERLVVHMIVTRYGTDQQQREAKEQLDRYAAPRTTSCVECDDKLTREEANKPPRSGLGRICDRCAAGREA